MQRGKLLAALLGIAMLSLASSQAHAAPSYNVNMPNLPNGWLYSRALGINNNGTIVGRGINAEGTMKALIWNNGVASEIATPWASSSANAINDNGAITGFGVYEYEEFGSPQSSLKAFYKDNNGVVDLGAAGGYTYSDGRAINNSGLVAGEGSGLSNEAFLWNGTAMQNVTPWILAKGNGINNQSDVVGYGWNGSNEHAFMSGIEGFLDLGTPTGFISSRAAAINDADLVVGYFSNGSVGAKHPFVWENDVFTELALPTGFTSGYATDINASGQIVGVGLNGDMNFHALLWSGNTVIDLTPDWDYAIATGINDSGTVIGYGDQNYNNLIMPLNTSMQKPDFYAFVANPVPEPASMLLLGSGLFGLLGISRRKKENI